MRFHQCQRLVLAWVFITCIVSHRCVAGPLPREFMFCKWQVQPSQVPNPLTNPFPRSVPFPQLANVFPAGRINLTHISPPLEFRMQDPEAKKWTGTILQTPPWPPPCPALPKTL